MIFFVPKGAFKTSNKDEKMTDDKKSPRLTESVRGAG